MKIERGTAPMSHGCWIVSVSAYELHVASGRALPYFTWIGTVNAYGKITVWTPAAWVPRGYRAAALAMLESARAQLIAEGRVGGSVTARRP